MVSRYQCFALGSKHCIALPCRKMCKNENCPICENTVKADNGIQCSGLCSKMYHTKCANFQGKDLQIMNNTGLRWFCTNCLPLLDFILKIQNDLNDFKKSVKDDLEEFRKTLNLEHTKKTESIKMDASYSKVVSGEALIIKPKAKQESNKTKEAVKKNLKPIALEVGITQMKNVKDGGILLKCKTKEEVEKIKKAAEKKLGKNYQVKIPEQKKPSIKIVDIDEEYSEDELISAIKKQNLHIRHDSMELKVIVFKQMRSRYQAIIECDPTTFQNIMKEKTLSIGFLCCRVHEYVRLFRCFKCGGFNHKADECKSDISCLNCGSSEHTKKDCENDVRCANCILAKKNLGLDLDVEHSIFDVNRCPILQRKINSEKQKIMANTADE